MKARQSKGFNFEGQDLFIGIDVHLRTWNVSILTASGFLERYSQPASAEKLFEHLVKKYPSAIYQAVYESGFSGFSTYYALTKYGIHCTIAHAADVPTTQRENIMKSDPIDSLKLAKALKSGLINSIYIPDENDLDDRSVVRTRKTIRKQLTAYQSRIKHLLYNHGVVYPEHFSKKGTHWSKRFVEWLEKEVILLSQTRTSLDMLLNMFKVHRQELLCATKIVRNLSRNDRYQKRCESLTSIPGIGMLTAMTILTEISDINRFRNQRQFASYLGLIPMSHSSGEKQSSGEMTFRGNKHIGIMLIEGAWTTIRHDRAMAACFGNYCQKMNPNDAIIRIARKLANRIMAVLKTETMYEYDKN